MRVVIPFAWSTIWSLAIDVNLKKRKAKEVITTIWSTVKHQNIQRVSTTCTL